MGLFSKFGAPARPVVLGRRRNYDPASAIPGKVAAAYEEPPVSQKSYFVMRR